MIKKIIKAINAITDELIGNNVIIAFNPPSVKLNSVTWNSGCKLSDYFGINNLYELYKQFVKNNEYNFILNDGSLIQLFYEFDAAGELKSHRLYFLHFPFLSDGILIEGYGVLDYLESWEDIKYLNNTYESEEYDVFFIINKFKSIGFIRFDYDPVANLKSPDDHPKCHLTINQEAVRIPVTNPMNPEDFLAFILTHYYSYDLKIKYNFNMPFNDSISDKEKSLMYFSSKV
ncbi:MAG: DUF2290 domain-containing protein [Neisseriaceae bacterium]|nr:MAG: DUF2290 domain-containing protein [Neisseriaceae bacterium]